MKLSHPIPYGEQHELFLPLEETKLIAEIGIPAGEPLDDPVAAVAAALVEPLDFPTPSLATVEGDSIVLAVDAAIPQRNAVIAGIVQSFRQDQGGARDIRVLLHGSADEQESLSKTLAARFGHPIPVDLHHWEDDTCMSYLAADKEGHPIQLNRLLCDADFLVTVGCCGPLGSRDYLGVYGNLFPTFSDRATYQRFFGTPAKKRVKHGNHLASAKEATWLLGTRFTVQVVPGADDRLLHVIAGDIDSVQKQLDQFVNQAWRFEVAETATLVIATLPGCRTARAWNHVARALEAAGRIVDADGAIVVCTDTLAQPSPALVRRMADPDDDWDESVRSPALEIDCRLATELQRVREIARVYLLSDLDPDTVSDMGFTPVESARQVENLARQFPTVTILSNAHRAWPTIV